MRKSVPAYAGASPGRPAYPFNPPGIAQFLGLCNGPDFGYSFGNRVKFLHLTPEPKPFSVGIVALKGKLSPVAEKFWQCAKEAASKK